MAGALRAFSTRRSLDVTHDDFLRRQVSIERQRRQDATLGPLKSKKARRVVPIGSVVVEALAAHLAAYPSDGALFVDELGQPLAYRRWRTIAEAAAKEASVDLTAHDLRHFYASALIAGGASVKQVQERLGHATAVITLGTYAHL
jgi:integrase